MLKRIIKALSEMGVSYSDMTMYFDCSQGAIHGWGKGRKPKNKTIMQLYQGIDQCRRLRLNLDRDTFVKQLIRHLEISEHERIVLREAYISGKENSEQDEGAYYMQFILDMIEQESWAPSPPKTEGTESQISTGISRVAVGGHHILAVKENGHVVATGGKDRQPCATHYWRDVISVGAGWRFSAGLKNDGTCVVAGENMIGNGEIFQWHDLAAIACGTFHLLGLRQDGTVVAYGKGGRGQCALEDWTGIRAIAAGNDHSVGLKEDGTVICAGKNDYGQCETEAWENVVAITAAGDHTVGLTKDGQILAVGDTESFSFAGWTDIIAIATGTYHVVGLRKDGSVIATGHESGGQCDVWKWHGVVEIAAGAFATAAVTAEGKVLCTHDPHENSMFYLDTSKWKLFEPGDAAAVTMQENRYETLRGNFLALLLRAKEHALQFTVNTYPHLDTQRGSDDWEQQLAKHRADEANRHMNDLFAVSKQTWTLHEQYAPLKPITDLIFRYNAGFCQLYATLTVETAQTGKIHRTSEKTYAVLEEFNLEIRTIEKLLREARS